jgi:hypothetical protein
MQNNKHKNDYESEISESTIKDINPFLLPQYQLRENIFLSMMFQWMEAVSSIH